MPRMPAPLPSSPYVLFLYSVGPIIAHARRPQIVIYYNWHARITRRNGDSAGIAENSQ